MQARQQKPSLFWTGTLVVLSVLWTRAPVVAADPLEDELVRGDLAAEAIIQELQAIDRATPIEVIGKHRKTDQVTGNVYTILKVRHGRKDVTATINEETGAFAPDRGLAERERQAVLDALPPVYRKMGPALLALVRRTQGGTLGRRVGLDKVLDVTFYTESTPGLDAIQATIGNVPLHRFDAPAMYAKNPPILHPDKNGVVIPVPPAPQIRTLRVRLPLRDVLRVGELGGVTHIDPTMTATPRLNVSVPRINANVVKGFGLDGFDADIGIVDTGIDNTHPNLQWVIAEADFSGDSRYCAGGANAGTICVCTGGACVGGLCAGGASHGQTCVAACGGGVCEGVEDDSAGHGTHVAGIAGNRNGVCVGGGNCEGMARFADLINAKALGPMPVGQTTGAGAAPVSAALVFAQGAGADVINGSYGFAGCTAPGLCAGAGACTAPPANVGNPCMNHAQCDPPLAPGTGFCRSRLCANHAACDTVPGAGDGVCLIPGGCTAPAANLRNPCLINDDCDSGPPPGGNGVCGGTIRPCNVNANCDFPGGAGNGMCTTPTSDGMSSRPPRDVDFQVFQNNITVAIAAEELGYHGRCTGGVNNGLVCNVAAHCPGGTCIAVPSTPNDAFNVITVGSTDLVGPPSTVSTWSQVGPTSDGRSKPDVIAPGESPDPAPPVLTDGIDSTAHNWEGTACTAPPANVGNACTGLDSECDSAAGAGDGVCGGPDFVDMEGTSMAAPHVAGLTALLWDWGENHGMLTDTPYLKAVIMNNARRLAGWTRPGIFQPLDTSQGTGEIEAERTFRAYADDLRVWQQQVTGTDDEHSHWYWIDFDGGGLPSDDPRSRIVVTLVFERHVTNPAVAGPPLNDLDVRLYDPNRVSVDSSVSFVDSVEHIVFPAPGNPAPPNGRYCIEVDPFNLDQGNELYAVACNYRLHFMGNVCPCIRDFGDAPDPFRGIPGEYPTLLANNGARHFDWTKEWLGTSRPEIDGELEKGTLAVQSMVDPFPSVSGENDANDPNDQDGFINLVNRDRYDDGVVFLLWPFLPGIPTPVDVTVQCTVDETGVGPTGRYDATVPTKQLYLNAWADWNGDGDWADAGEKIIGVGSPIGQFPIDPETFGVNGAYTIGEQYTDVNGSGEWEPNEPYVDTVGATEDTFTFWITPPPVIAPEFYTRFRLDYGEDVGNLLPPPAPAWEEHGEAKFGEVEDYFQEIDYFPTTEAIIDITTPMGSDTITVTGPTTVAVNFASLGDADGDGLEDVPTEIVQMELTGDSALLGPVTVRVRPETSVPFLRSIGEIEEKDNPTPGVLDLPPFTATGAASSYFDVYFEVEAAGETYHNETVAHMEAQITHKPPEGEPYENPFTIALVDESGGFTGIEVVHEIHTPSKIEKDFFPDSVAKVTISVPGIGTEGVTLVGPTMVHVDFRSLGDGDGNGLEGVPAEIVSMELSGNSALLGPVTLRVRPDTSAPFQRSVGEIEEKANNVWGVLDIPPFAPGAASSYFDVYFEVEAAGETYHNETPARMEAQITHKPPAEGEPYENPFTIALVDESGAYTGIELVEEIHIPNPFACCVEDGTCLDGITVTECEAQGGIYQGPSTFCTVPEPCCLADGSCINVDPLCCAGLGGVPQGEGTTTCTAPEACCLPDDICQMLDPLCCVDQGGIPQGPETACTTAQGCCLGDGSCITVDPLCCEKRGGRLLGFDMACSGQDVNENGIDDICEVIPTASGWGLIVMALLLMTAGKVYFGRRRASAATA